MAHDRTPFSQQIATLSRGMLDEELTEELAALVKAISEHGKKGTLTLTLSLKPEVVRGDVVNVQITPEVKVSKPAPQRLSTRMYPTRDGSLLRNDPNQPELDLREVDINKPSEAREL